MEIGGISTPFDDAICPMPGGNGAGATDVGGVDVKDGTKGTTGEMPEVSGVDIKDASSPGTSRPPNMMGS